MFGTTYLVAWIESETDIDNWKPFYDKEEALRAYHFHTQCKDSYSVSMCEILRSTDVSNDTTVKSDTERAKEGSTDYPYEPSKMEAAK